MGVVRLFEGSRGSPDGSSSRNRTPNGGPGVRAGPNLFYATGKASASLNMLFLMVWLCNEGGTQFAARAGRWTRPLLNGTRPTMLSIPTGLRRPKDPSCTG